MREEHSNCDPMSNKVKQEYEENLRKLQELQRTLQNQVDTSKINKNTNDDSSLQIAKMTDKMEVNTLYFERFLKCYRFICLKMPYFGHTQNKQKYEKTN